LNGVIQKPNSSYTIAGAVITFSSNLVTGDVINFIQILGSVLDVGTVSDATITIAKTNFVSTSSAAGLQIKGDGTTDGTLQLNCSQNSHGIKIKSPPHSASASYTLTMPNNDGDANQFLQTNGSGVLSFAAAGGTNTPRVSVDKTGSSQSVSSGSWTKVTLNTERVDSDNAFTSNTFTVPSGEGGDYYMSAFAMITDLNGTSDYASLRLANSGNSTVYNGTANAGNSGYGWVTMAISCIRTLSAGDTVSLWIYGSEAIGVNEDNANLSVIKLI
jgi:hypothetical protein